MDFSKKSRIYFIYCRRGEMADTVDSKSTEGNLVRVQVSPPASGNSLDYEELRNDFSLTSLKLPGIVYLFFVEVLHKV